MSVELKTLSRANDQPLVTTDISGTGIPVVQASGSPAELMQAAVSGAAFPGAPNDVRGDERLALWYLISRRDVQGVRDAEQDSTYDELVSATIGAGPYVAFGLGALSFAVLPDFWAALAAGTAVVLVVGGGTAFHFLGKKERRVKGAEEWKTLRSKAHVLDATQFVQRLFAHKSVLSPAMAKLLDMKAGDEDKILAEMGAADLVALGRLTSRVQLLPGGVPFEPAGESRELVSRVLECLWPDSAPLSFQSPKIGPVSL